MNERLPPHFCPSCCTQPFTSAASSCSHVARRSHNRSITYGPAPFAHDDSHCVLVIENDCDQGQEQAEEPLRYALVVSAYLSGSFAPVDCGCGRQEAGFPARRWPPATTTGRGCNLGLSHGSACRVVSLPRPIAAWRDIDQEKPCSGCLWLGGSFWLWAHSRGSRAARFHSFSSKELD